MNYKMMGRFIAQILSLEGIFMLPALTISVHLGEHPAIRGFAATIVILLAISAALRMLCRGAKSNFYATDGMVCVALSWIILSLTGCLPFVISREIPRFIDALFEIVSGFTTSGGTVLAAGGSNGMGMNLTATQPCLTFGSSGGMGGGPNSGSAITKNAAFTVTDSDGNTIYSGSAVCNASFLFFSSPDLTDQAAYTLAAGTTSLTAETQSGTVSSGFGGMGGGPGNRGDFQPGDGQQPPEMPSDGQRPQMPSGQKPGGASSSQS